MRGAIAAGHPLSAEAGARVLAAGGNAMDALLAAAFAAFVTEGPLTGPAGGGFVLVREPDGTSVVLDCFFAVPRRPLGEMEEVVIDFADAGTQVFHVGPGAVAVPGLLAGLEEAHARYGSRPWEELVAPALALAAAGVRCDAARLFLHRILEPILLREEGGRRLYGTPGRVRTADLSATLERVRDVRAAAAAELLPEYADDLAAYRVAVRAPLAREALGGRALSAPPPSRGGAVVLDIVERLGEADDGAPALAAALARAYGRAAAGRPTGTTHISALDAQGLACGLSSTLGSGSGVFRGGAQLNNMLGELDVIGPGPRTPGERLPSMLAPTLLLREGGALLLLGSAGSVRLAGAIAQVAWRAAAGAPLAEAIAAPRLHAEARVLHVEGGWSERELAGLDGFELVRWGGRNLFFGGVQAVGRRPDGSFEAAGDPRRGGAGLVVP